MNDYCQFPVSIQTPVEPNVLFLIDTSGSMGWKAYSYGDSDRDGDGYLDGYNGSVTYEGYFDPEKHYREEGGVFVEATPTGSPCVKTCTQWKCRSHNLGDCVWNAHGCSGKWACCVSWESSGDCDIYSGNYLNYAHMTRIDLLRWALTGGRPESCNNSIRSCDPEVYPDTQLSCDADGCVLETNEGIKVKVPWERISGARGGLLFQLKNLSPRPLIGAMFFDTSGVTRTVYIGDFVASASFDGVNPYKNVITAINYEPPGGATPTAPALWDAYNYFAQRSPQYGGPQPQTGSGNEWKNPMYRCFDANGDGNCQGNEFELVSCAKNFVVLLTDGQWNRGGYPVISTCRIDADSEAESPDPSVPAYFLHKRGFTNEPTGIQSYVESLYTVGLWLGGTGELALKNIAMYGSFDRSREWPGGTSGYPGRTCGPVDDCCSYSNCGKGSPCTPLPSPSFSDWDRDGDGLPDTFYKADDAVQIKERLIDVMLDILRHASSGTAASVLASSEGSGANLFQAVFYPKRAFEKEEVDWTGELHALWYYVDPNLQNLNIREDTDENETLNLKDDRVVQFFFDEGANEVKVKKYSDTDGDGSADTLLGTYKLDDTKSLFRVGYLLWKRALSSSPRTIYTSSGTSLLEFSSSNASTLKAALGASTDDEARRIIDYVHGYDSPGLRERSATISGETHTWKLGDIVSSTPKLLSNIPLNSYHLSSPLGYDDASYYDYINSSSYKVRGMVFFGANDGMLHAVRIGRLEFSWDGRSSYEVARLSGTDLGSEAWAFIPRHALPYLKYLADPSYCHLFYVDLTPYIFDASIGGAEDAVKTLSSWRTILIGGMGLGGASRDYGSSCSDCVKTPSLGLGFSSYFALDITDPENPQFLWEFSDSELGFATSGPAVVRIGDPAKNGRWFVVFGSGPTGPIDRNYRQFLGRSDQTMKLFILDLKTGRLLRKIDTGISNAFSGSLFNATLDCEKGAGLVEGSCSDDVIYVGYTKWDGAWKGGVLRLVTKEKEPSEWVFSKVIDGIGPVTSAVTKLVNRRDGTLWLYFGTGRFFYKKEAEIDDADSTRAIYGIKEPCYTLSNDMDSACTQEVSASLLTDSTSSPPSSAPVLGWYVNLDASSGARKAERVITDPLAIFSGIVFFTTFSPSSDVCSRGGATHIWAVRYDTGGVPGTGTLKGKAILQVSTGEIKEVELVTAFSEKGGRRTEAIVGMPPKGQALAVIYPPRPMKKVIHIKER